MFQFRLKKKLKINMTITALIPARANSERFVGKNYANFLGKPLFLHSTDFAEFSPLVDEYYVTTNDEQVIAICNENRIQYVERPEVYCTDISTNSDYIAHFLKILSSKKINLPDALLILQPTNPIREHNILEEMVQLFHESNADCVFTVVECKSKVGSIVDGIFIPSNYKFEQRFQDIESSFEENGMFYLVNVVSFLRNGCLFGKINVPHRIPIYYKNIDIDTELEMKIAERVYHKFVRCKD